MIRKLALLIGMLLLFAPAYAQAVRPQIVASFSILADVAQNVAGDAADVSTLIPPGADPHAYTPAPGDLAKIADADAILISGAGYEAGVLEAIENAGAGITPIVISECVEILAFGGEGNDDHAHVGATPAADDPVGQRCAAYAAELDALHADETHDHGAGEILGRLHAINCEAGREQEADDGHEHGACDPHVWLDPQNVELWTLSIRDALSSLDPANADTYAHNAAAYLDALVALEHDVIEPAINSLPEDRRVLVTDHEALGYFAHAYHFTVVGVVVPSVSSVGEPSAQAIAALIDTIRAQHVPAVFAASTSPALSQQVAQDAGAQFYTLYTETLSDSSGDAPTYLDFMRYNVQTIVAALS